MAIDLQMMRDRLRGITLRSEHYYDVLQWMTGGFASSYNFAALLPPIEGEEGSRAYNRLKRLAQSLGPRAYRVKRNGTLGSLNWGEGGGDIDARLESLNLMGLANRLLERGMAQGIMAGIVAERAIMDEQGILLGSGDIMISRLGGYVEPLTDAYDYDLVAGLIQIEQLSEIINVQRYYRVRLYDFEQQTLTEWSRVTDPSAISSSGVIFDNAPMPRYVVLETAPDGLPIGEFDNALPTLQSEWASQVRADRVEESAAFPLLTISGEAVGASRRGVTRVIELAADGDAKYLLPGDMSQIHKHQDRKRARLRDDLSLPGEFMGADTPSGEALREARMAFTASCAMYAGALSTLLTELVADYAELVGLANPPNIAVDINRDVERESRSELILELYREGLVPRDEVVRAMSYYLPTWRAEDVEAWIASSPPLVNS